ncbi:virion structural protein [Agrobacterium phage 7-7-1]|uniref:Structural protein n=1 Tax=Agrobacterium phage 7-7-1 TaxID=1161931 RepID=J7FA76_9CAUD|nr:virion structural protein [Agrobacterium phage 7-7-1]AFH19804.1 structural protein [Agrobacterium phage 7-7-1]
MAKGKPYLATWAANVLSLWRMDSNNVFQAVANAAVNSSLALASLPFSLAASFTPDSKFVSVSWRDGAGFVAARSYSTTALALIGNQTIVNNVSATWGAFADKNKLGLVSALATIDTTSNGRKTNLVTGALEVAANIRSLVYTPNYAKVAIHPNGSYLIRPRSNPTGSQGININFNTVAPGVAGYPDFTSIAQTTTATSPQIAAVAAAWSPGGDLIYFLNTAGEIVVVPFNTPATLTPSSAQVIAAVGQTVSTVPSNGLGVAEGSQIIPDRSGSFVAVVHYNSSAYTTVIYQRVGSTLTEIQRIAGFGKAAAFTEDSRYIIDVNSKKAFGLNPVTGLYDVDVSATMLANVPVSPFGFLSADIDAVEGIANVYNVAVSRFLSCGVALNGLKMIFLSPAASFNASATTIAAAVNGFAVSDPNVPATGLALQNAQIVDGVGGQVTLKADDLAVSVANDFTFRYSALVDETNDKPIAFFDWGENFTIDALSGVDIDLSSRGIVLFGV